MLKTITPILSIILSLVIFFVYVKPTFTEIKGTKAEIDAYDKAIDQSKENTSLLTDLLAKKNAYPKEDLDRLEAIVPVEVNSVKLLADLSEIAKKHNVLFGNIVVGDKDGQGGGKSSEESLTPSVQATLDYKDIAFTDISFGIIGTYDEFKSFLFDVEQSLTLMEVVGISMGESEAGKDELGQYEITIRVFALPKTSQS